MDKIQKFLIKEGRRDLAVEYGDKMAATTKYKGEEIYTNKFAAAASKALEGIDIDGRKAKMKSYSEGGQKRFFRGVVKDGDTVVAKVYFEVYSLAKPEGK